MNEENNDRIIDKVKLQLDAFRAMADGFITVSVIDSADGTAVLIKGNEERNYFDGNMVPTSYKEVCDQCVRKHVIPDEKEYVEKVISLENVVKELESKNTYEVTFGCVIREEERLYQMKFTSLENRRYILTTFRLLDTLSKEDNTLLSMNADQLRKERLFLDVLCRDYSSVYFYDMNLDAVEVLKINASANATDLIVEQLRSSFQYSSRMEKYCRTFVVDDMQEEYLSVLSKKSIEERLAKESRFIYRYDSKPNKVGKRHFEAHVLRLNEKKFDHTAILAFREIDDVIESELQWKKDKEEKFRVGEQNKILKSEKKDAVLANESKSRFLSSLSHDIRTPINGIQGMLRMMESYAGDEKKQKECIEKLWMATNYLDTLVSNVLDMNRLESHSISLVEKPFNLIDLLMSITSICASQAEEHSLHSVVDWKPGYIEHRYLIGSAEGISRILTNLNSNAIKYNKPNGEIYCRCKEVKVEGDTAWFEFINADTGIGMEKDFLEHAFEPYIQKDNISLSSINGVGLGLSIVKQMVKLMGGTIDVESEVGKGTKYTILLPFKIDSTARKPAVPLEKISLKGVKALLVEDNNLNMEISKFYLEQEKVDVTCAVNGKEAVSVFENSEPGYFNIILMDIVMPEMDGFTATRTIRSLNRSDAKSIPIIAMSANAFEEDIRNSMEAGMNDYLVKPLNGQSIATKMKEYLADHIVK